MSKNYGMMISFEDAIKMVELELPTFDDGHFKERALNRLRYECDKSKPVAPKYNKGRYGSKYDSYSCGNCGHGGIESYYHYCPNCGYAIGWKEVER